MDGARGRITLTERTDRQQLRRTTAFAIRWVPAVRRSRRRLHTAAVVLAMAGVPLFWSFGEGQIAGTAPLGVGLAAGGLYLALVGSRWFQTSLIARRNRRALPASAVAAPTTFIFDDAGFEVRQEYATTRLGWPVFSAIVEGDRHIALCHGAGFISVPIDRLSEGDRAVVRRWVEAAAGECRWIVRRARPNPRLKVSPSPAAPSPDGPRVLIESDALDELGGPAPAEGGTRTSRSRVAGRPGRPVG